MTQPSGMLARAARHLRRLTEPAQPASTQAPPKRRTQADTTASGRDPDTREALIAEAMRIHRSKRVMLDDLDDENRILLEVMAHHLLVEAGRPDPATNTVGPDDQPRSDTRGPSAHPEARRPERGRSR